jgi:UDP-N-acetylmuramyl pentapeptide phosphotransferase/UDP-N-acetylglucosamine-1-phosphate transferase
MTDMAQAAAAWGLLAPLMVAAAAVLSAGLIAMLLPALRRHALARPNARSSHREPTPQGGGIAVIAATVAVAALAAFAFVKLRPDDTTQLLWVLGATVLMAGVGAVDDIRAVPVLPRLLLQALAVAIAVTALPADLRIVPALPWWIERTLLVGGGLYFLNLVNFMDGIDWMTVAEVVPVTGGLLAAGWLGALPAPGIVAALALLGAVLGFAPFNRPVARLFLGDVGSLPIGLLLAWLLALVAGNGHLAAALLLPLYYLADASLTLARRLMAGERVWQAHRTHFYQRATDRGFTVSEIVGRVFALNVVLATLGVISIAVPAWWMSFAALAAGAALVASLLALFARGRTTPRA